MCVGRYWTLATLRVKLSFVLYYALETWEFGVTPAWDLEVMAIEFYKYTLRKLDMLNSAV